MHAPWNEEPYDWDVRPAYSVDNLWGLEEPDFEHTQFHFKVTYHLSEIGEPIDDKLPFRQNYFWQLHNFDTARLDMDQYARTFADVDSSEPWWSFDPAQYVDAGLEALYYHVVYKGVAGSGNCFGMSVEAVYALKGRSILTEPVFRLGHPQVGGDFPGEPDPVLDRGMINEFNVKHGYQVGAPTVAWFLQLFGLGLTHDPKEIFRMARTMFEDGVAEPWHLLDRVPTLPGADLFLEGAKGFVALLSGDADGGAGDAAVQQVVDGAGRTLFEPGLGRVPDRWSDLRRDPAARIPGLAPIPISAGDAESVGPRPLLFFGRGQDTTHTYQVTGGGGRTASASGRRPSARW